MDSHQAYYQKNKARIKKRVKEYSENNKEKVAAASKKYREKNKEKAAIYAKNYRENNREKINAINRKSKKKNRVKVNLATRKYVAKRRREDPLFALKCRLRARTKSAFKAQKLKKNTKTQKMLGCDWVTLVDHLEKRFLDGMNWVNMGEWEVDHVIPLSSAKTEEEMFLLCHYTNLQPLWEDDNNTKSDKMPNELIAEGLVHLLPENK